MPIYSKIAILALLIGGCCTSSARSADEVGASAKKKQAIEDVLAGKFRWKSTPPLISSAARPDDPCRSIKDPSVVWFDKRWHIFATIRSEKRTHQIEYLNFTDWKEAEAAPRQVMKLSDGYFCAPQVFYFTPHKKWYLIYQVNDAARKPALQPAFSTSDKLDDPASWSKPELLFAEQPDNIKGWIDFWVICDAERAYLFFTSNDGRMWRSETKLADFPRGFDPPRVVLQGDIFEASHTYKLTGVNKYLTLIEAVGEEGRRYYKAYLADRLDGEWTSLAGTREKTFADKHNVRFTEGNNVRSTDGAWSDSISHGELLRPGVDEKMEADPSDLRFLYQGVADTDRKGKPYGDIPWKLGILTPDAGE